MRHGFLRILLGFGVVFGVLFGVRSLFCHHHRYGEEHRAAFEDHVADVCVKAAERAHKPRQEK